MLFRRTGPLPALAATTPVMLVDVALGPSLATAFVYTDLLYAVAVYGPRKAVNRLLGSTIAVSALMAIAVGLACTTLRGLIVAGAVLALSLVSPVLTGLAIRQYRDNAGMERLRAEQVARLAELDRRRAVAAERSPATRRPYGPGWSSSSTPHPACRWSDRRGTASGR
jgi:hypothetical protein